MTIKSATAAESKYAALDRVERSVRRVIERHRNLIVTTLAELSAAGVDARVIDQQRYHPLAAGHVAALVDVYDAGVTGGPSHSYLSERTYDFEPGPRVHCDTLHVSQGLWRVLVVEPERVLIASVETGWEEAGRQKSIARLRTLARRDEMRVRVRDHDVRLLDPLGNVVHAGTVASAFMFILNIDPETEDGAAS